MDIYDKTGSNRMNGSGEGRNLVYQTIFETIISVCQYITKNLPSTACYSKAQKLVSDANLFLTIPWTLEEIVKFRMMEDVWMDSDFQKVFAEYAGSKISIPDGVLNLLQEGSFERFDPTKYIPSKSDIHHSYRKTTGIVEVTLTTGNESIVIVDTGGQRSERKKWTRYLKRFSSGGDNGAIEAICYFVSLVEYDLFCYEDDRTNRTLENLGLFYSLFGRKKINQHPSATSSTVGTGSISSNNNNNNNGNETENNNNNNNNNNSTTNKVEDIQNKAAKQDSLITEKQTLGAVVDEDEVEFLQQMSPLYSIDVAPVPIKEDAAIYIIFTKIDLFKNKFTLKSFQERFPNFTGTTYMDGIEFIRRKFLSLMDPRFKKVSTQLCNVTDDSAVKKLIEGIFASLLEYQMQKKREIEKSKEVQITQQK